MAAKPQCPGSPKATHGSGTGAHNWLLAGPYDGDKFRRGISHAARGRSCHWCKLQEPDYLICASWVSDGGRWPSYHRCERPVMVWRPIKRTADGRPFGLIISEAVVDEQAPYCRMHDPEAVASRRAAAPLAQWERDNIRRQRESALREAVERWDRDEQMVEGFCTPDSTCEHHECKLHEAWLAFREPLPATRGEAGLRD